METDVEGEQFAHFLDAMESETNKESRGFKTEKNTGEKNAGERITEETTETDWDGFFEQSYPAFAVAFIMVIIIIFFGRVSRRKLRAFSQDKRSPLLLEARVVPPPPVTIVQMPKKTVKKESSLIFI